MTVMLDKIYVDHGSWDFYYDSIEDAIENIRRLNDGVFPSDPPLAYFAYPAEVKVLCNFSEFVNDMLDVAFEGKAKQLKGEKELIEAFLEFEWVNRDVLIHYPDYDRPINWSDHVWYV